MLNPNKVSNTVELKVLVRFIQADGSAYDGDFVGVFKRPADQEEVERVINEGWTNKDVVDEYLIGAKKIGASPSEELSPEDGLAFVKKQPECVNASVTAFFQSFAPDRQREKTSGRRR
ncbi:MAG TPA: hypothetical protein VEC14_13315 [Reyranellaceae bacterium]|nr:hypothetical protein [Reyranellaceae bacterium]